MATAVKGCAEIITLHGNINIDFADVNTVMRNSGVFIMGTGFAEGDNRALKAVEEALRSPLLDSNDIHGTENILLNITSGDDEVRMGEIGQIIDYLQDAAGDNANIIWGNGFDPSLGSQICVTIIATGFEINPNRILRPEPKTEKIAVNTDPAAIETVKIEEEEVVPVKKVDIHAPIAPEPVVLASDEESFTVKTTNPREPVQREVKKSAKPKIEKESEPISNWFLKQFNTLFTENDADIDDDQGKK